MKGLNFFYFFLVFSYAFGGHAQVFNQIIKTPQKYISGIATSVSSSLSEPSKGLIVTYGGADTAYIKTQYDRCAPQDLIVKKKTLEEEQQLKESFYFETCGQTASVLSFTRKCSDIKPIELSKFIQGEWPTAENCDFWQLTNTYSTMKTVYNKSGTKEELNIYVNDGDFVFDLKVYFDTADGEKKITTTIYIADAAESYRAQFSAFERMSPNTQTEYYFNGGMVSPALYSQHYLDHVDHRLKNIIYRYGVWTSLLDYIN